jgi:segregation and condensation protein A
MEALTYRIDQFEGPLDLLLTLIQKNKVNIEDIPIALICDQYLEYIKAAQNMDMELAGEFIVMASELMLIKSRMLLPKPEDPDAEDPRARLAAALLAYRQAKEAAAYLESQYACFSARYVNDEDEIPVDNGDISQHDIQLLQKALARLFSKKDKEAPPPMTGINPIIKKTVVPVSDKIRDVSRRLSMNGTTPFLSLFAEAQSKSEIVALFMAVLSLIKDGYVLLEKRLAAASEEEDALWDSVEEYRYEFYCTLNPEQAVPEDYAGLFDETGGGNPSSDETTDSQKGDTE